MRRLKMMLCVVVLLLSACAKEEKAEKPVVYLYPDREMQVEVKLDYEGDLLLSYPEYREGWRVKARPDGTLISSDDGREYSYLFWEGEDDHRYEMSRGFVVKGEDTAEFLREKLSLLGLTPREYNEFIVYWLPRMKENAYNLICFQGEEYTKRAKLSIEPSPDSMLRVFMVYQPLDAPISVEEQELRSFERRGFSVIEWGGKEQRP